LVHYQVQLPSAIAGVHGTVFESSVADDSSGSVTVRQGEVQVEGFARPEGNDPTKAANGLSLGQWVEVLRAGMRIDVSKTGKPTKPRTVDNTSDDWKRLNDERECICD
jgi:ferric-dicitrate binding protein FerR (iron transport regulator)